MARIEEYKKKDGKKYYRVKVYVGYDPHTGRQRQTTRSGFKTKKEAKIAASRMEVDTADYGISSGGNPSFREVYEEWFQQNRLQIKPTTAYTKQRLFKRILGDMGDWRIKKIERRDCQRLVNRWAQQLKSFRDYKVQANLVFKYAVKMNIIKVNPMEHIMMPKLDVSDMEEKENFFTKQQLHTFLNHLKGSEEESRQKVHLMFRMLAYTGVRKGELQGLHWSDVDLKEKTIRVNKTLAFVDSKKVVIPTKTQASIRTVSLDDETVRLLHIWRKQQMQWYMRLGLRFQKAEEQPVFTNFHYSTQRMDYCKLSYLNETLQRISKELPDLPRIGVHGFRHTHASLLFEAGLSIKDVQVRLGHKDIHTTMNTYTHVTPDRKDTTAAAFQQFMDG
ncbi:site-specific integrase [Alkalicoccus chagannorensis]|uniref:site-specific integrase n=1 Tax=Alkalicoccus chagannorensis TaxID=427072 RepID=UPI0003FF4214|nr:site-specific integrase [Alkalicoccus chagannorensis]